MKRAFVRLRRRDAIGVLAAAAWLATGLPWTARSAWSDVATGDAEALVRALAAQIWQVLGRTDLDDQGRIDEMAVLLTQATDVELVGRLVLGRYWQQLDPQQQARYQVLFRDVVMHTLARRLNQYAKDAQGPLEERFALISSAPAGKSDILVRSRVKPRTGDPLAVDWRLREGDGGPVIIDVIIGGVSLVLSQRSEFAAVIERSDMEGLFAELEARANPTKS